MTLLLDVEIDRTLDALVARFAADPRPDRRVEAWLFEDAPARAAAAARLAAAGTPAHIRSAYKPLLHYWLDDADLAGAAHVTIRTPCHPSGSPARFQLEAYPLAGLCGDIALDFQPGGHPLDYEVVVTRGDGAQSTHRVFAPNRAFTDHLGRDTLAPCGWLSVWDGDVLVEDAAIETEFEAAFRLTMEAVAGHQWGTTTPYFETLEIAVETGGVERPLAYMDECVSTREALHEDLYFSLLELFQHHAGRGPGDRGVQPGQIIPDIHPANGPTRVRVTIGPPTPFLVPSAPSLDLATAARPLTFDEVHAELATLGGSRFDGRSTQGRAVWATHVTGPASRTTPGIVISAAQHANETSGIVGALRAAHVLASQGEDFALIPIANPDGHALHHRLRATHARHMHHAARYTALGDDFEVRTAPPLLEKATRLEAFRRTGAGLHLNLHGYPAHEWTRPLTGYVPRGFESWAVPRGYFLILRHAPGLADAADRFLRALTARLAAVPGLADYNARHLASYAAHAGAPPSLIHDGIPCLVHEAASSDVPVTLITEYPDETVYDGAFRLAHDAQTATVLAAVALFRAPGGLGEAMLRAGSDVSQRS